MFSDKPTHLNTSGNDSEGKFFDYWFRVLHSHARLFSKPDAGQVHINLLTQTSVREKCPEATFEAAAALHLTYTEHIHQNAPLYNNVSARATFLLPSGSPEDAFTALAAL